MNNITLQNTVMGGTIHMGKPTYFKVYNLGTISLRDVFISANDYMDNIYVYINEDVSINISGYYNHEKINVIIEPYRKEISLITKDKELNIDEIIKVDTDKKGGKANIGIAIREYKR